LALAETPLKIFPPPITTAISMPRLWTSFISCAMVFMTVVSTPNFAAHEGLAREFEEYSFIFVFWHSYVRGRPEARIR